MYPSFQRTLCQDFVLQAEETWNMMKLGHDTKIDVAEESITDWNLLKLQVNHPHEIRTQKFTKPVEGREGADWEWWLGEDDLWLGLRVQAKRIDSDQLRYQYLNHKTRYGNQADLLIDYAGKSQPPRIPVYVFYNYWDSDKFDPHWLCPAHPKKLEMLGCGVVEATLVRSILARGHDDIQTLSSVMYPWSCLVCCQGFSRGDYRLPFAAFRFLSSAFKIERKDAEKDLYEEKRFVSKSPPEYVYRILEGEKLSSEEWEKIGLKTISVIRRKNVIHPFP